MSLFETMHADAEDEIRLIRSEAEKNCSAVLSAAHADSEKKISECRRKAAEHKKRSLTTADSEARIDYMTQTGKAFEQIILQLREKVFSVMESRWKDNFAETAADFLLYGAHCIGVSGVSASFAAQYEKHFNESAEKIRSSLEKNGITLGKVSFDLASRGGVIIASADARRVRTETFEESFRRIEDDVRMSCSERLGRE